ncbi:SGNH/GDSL hydrolase family protein [Sphingomonas sp. CL5.1]|uniref:SGNH/GDSL hydrolase family protein n=1 Tax=Sphingomonas sp. CL5.1 TaxID=2653203 RepID=UPI0015826451|nr:SGNH/GDSL hydrolase family protein [Sphingomonas sp. CL5.1]QKR99428.1 SGNH/GDSL hydrolase family protein [Sphingomonas sp. CL5.1]
MSLGFALGARARRGGLASPPPAVAALPQQAAIVARWSADEIPSQADNSALAGWTDSVGGLVAAQATAAAQPKYRVGGAGGKPYVLFSGAQYLDAGTSNAVASACQSATSSAFVVCRNVQASSFGFLFTASNSTGYNLFANGAQAGFFGNGLGRCPYAGSGLTTLGYTAGRPETTSARYFVNNSCVTHLGKLTAAAGHNVGIGGSPATPATAAKAEIYEVIVWNRALTAAEMMQVEIWARGKYAAPLPWAGGPFRLFHGDSLTNGYSMTAPLNSYPAKVAAMNGWSLGTWTNLGHVGISMTAMDAEAAAEIDPMLALLGSTPAHLAAWEWYNQRGLSTAVATAATEGYFRARRAAGVAKLVLLTSTDAADPFDLPAARAAYNGYFDVNGPDFCDAYVALHADAMIGVEGACPNAAPYGPTFHSDGIHLTDAGYAVLAGIVAPVMAAL